LRHAETQLRLRGRREWLFFELVDNPLYTIFQSNHIEVHDITKREVH
jgi:hypothetical protein